MMKVGELARLRSRCEILTIRGDQLRNDPECVIVAVKSCCSAELLTNEARKRAKAFHNG
jgi:hypothetical protein